MDEEEHLTGYIFIKSFTDHPVMFMPINIKVILGILYIVFIF